MNAVASLVVVCVRVFRRRAVWSTLCVWEFCLPSPSPSHSTYSYKEDAEGVHAIALRDERFCARFLQLTSPGRLKMMFLFDDEHHTE